MWIKDIAPLEGGLCKKESGKTALYYALGLGGVAYMEFWQKYDTVYLVKYYSDFSNQNITSKKMVTDSLPPPNSAIPKPPDHHPFRLLCFYEMTLLKRNF